MTIGYYGAQTKQPEVIPQVQFSLFCCRVVEQNV